MTGLAPGALIACGGLIIALWAVCKYANEKVDRVLAQHGEAESVRRALAAEAAVRSMNTRLATRLTDKVTPDWETHTDQALEAAEPTPDLRRVR